MTKNNPEKKGVRIPSQALLWILSIALGLTACGGHGGRGGGDNAAVPDATPVPPPRLVTPFPMETEEAVRPTINPKKTKPAPTIISTPQLVQPPEDLGE